MTIVSTPVNDLMKIVARAGEIAGSYGRTRVFPERIDAVTRANLVVTHVHQELESFTLFLYRRDSYNRLLHVLPDGQFAYGVWAPWGVHARVTLTRSQRDTLRRWLLIKASAKLRPPFVYHDTTRRWYLDITRYPTVNDTLAWLENHRLTGNAWLNLSPQVSN